MATTDSEVCGRALVLREQQDANDKYEVELVADHKTKRPANRDVVHVRVQAAALNRRDEWYRRACER